MKDQYHASLKNQLLRQKLQLTQTEAETPRVSAISAEITDTETTETETTETLGPRVSSKSRSRYTPTWNVVLLI